MNETHNDYVKRSDVVDVIADYEKLGLVANEGLRVKVESGIPAADVALVIRGRWEPFANKRGQSMCECNICNYHIRRFSRKKYCPDCGAKMEQEENNGK